MNEVIGVGFILLTIIKEEVRMYTVKELKSKPSIKKEIGMIGPPFETMEKSDAGKYGTLKRLVQEETSFKERDVLICGVSTRKFNIFHERPEISTYYGYGVFRGDPSLASDPPDKDINFAGWKTVAEMRNEFVRPETLPILNHFTASENYLTTVRMLYSCFNRN